MTLTPHDWWLVLALVSSGSIGALLALDLCDLLKDREK